TLTPSERRCGPYPVLVRFVTPTYWRVTMKRMGLVALVLMLSGCATMETTRGNGGQYAPTNEGRGGTVKYNNQGLGARGRRQSAYKKMAKFCGGPYRIVTEQTGREGGAIVPVGGIYAVSSQS